MFQILFFVLIRTIVAEHTVSRSAVAESPSSKTTNSLKLTNEQYWKTLVVYYTKPNSRDSLAAALYSISEQDEPMVSKSDANYELNYQVNENYDTNKDGIATRKEFGEYYLDDLYKGL